MAMKMKDFLSEYYKRLIFRDMPIEQFAQYCEYVKANDFNGNMGDWRSLLEKDPADPTGRTFLIDPATKLYVRKEMLTDADLEPADWDKLYKVFQEAFRNMASSRSSLDEKTVKFLDKYFGKDLSATPPVARMFDHSVATPRVDGIIQNDLKNFFVAKESELKIILKSWGYINDSFSYEDLLDGIRSKKYNSDAGFQSRLINIVNGIIGSNQDDLKKNLNMRRGERIPDLTDIPGGFNTDYVNPYQLNNFKLEYDTILRELYSNSKVFDDFKNYDGGKVSKPITKAKELLNYNDLNSNEYVKPKREDELTIGQRLSDFAKNTYADYFEKYVTLNGDRFFFSGEAKLIVAALNKAKVKPTSGLAGVLKEAGNIEKNLKLAGKFKAAKHAKWFVQTLTEFSNDKNMSRIFAGALNNSTHMKALIRELIIKAVRENKIDEAKTAMEVLSVIKYGYTTSKIMDAIRKEPLSIFSDKGLSWNKNEGMQFVTNALDRSIKYAFTSLGYGITFVGNAIRLSGSKIKKTTGALNQERKARLQADADAKNSLDAKIASEQAQIATLNSSIAVHTAAGRTEASLNADMTRANADRAAAIAAAQNALQPVVRWLNPTPETDPDYDAVYDYYEAVVDSFSNGGTTQGALPPLPNGLTGNGGVLHGVEAAINTQLQTIGAKTAEYDTANTYLNDLVNATETLSALSDQLARHTEESRTWDDKHHDKVEELINYWNLLEKGRNTHSGPMFSWFGRKKTQEKKFNNIKGVLIQNAMKNKIKQAA